MRRIIYIFLLTLISDCGNAKIRGFLDSYPIRTEGEDKLEVTFVANLQNKSVSLFVLLKGDGHGACYGKFFNRAGQCMLFKFNSTHRFERKNAYFAVAQGLSPDQLSFIQAGDIVGIKLYDKTFICNELSNDDLKAAVSKTFFWETER